MFPNCDTFAQTMSTPDLALIRGLGPRVGLSNRPVAISSDDGVAARERVDYITSEITNRSRSSCASDTGLSLLDLASPRDFPNRLDSPASYAINLIVHVDRAAHVIRNYLEPLANTIFAR